MRLACIDIGGDNIERNILSEQGLGIYGDIIYGDTP